MPKDTTERGVDAAGRTALASTFSIDGWGRFAFAWNEVGLILLGLPDRAPGEHLGRLAAHGITLESTPDVPFIFRAALEGYCNGAGSDLITLDVAPVGTKFQTRVWHELRRIPLGETRTYRTVARALGQPRSVLAVANACAANLLSIAIPDHRVIAQDGDPGTFAAGVAWKQRLLEHEARMAAGAEPATRSPR